LPNQHEALISSPSAKKPKKIPSTGENIEGKGISVWCAKKADWYSHYEKQLKLNCHMT
jgi:hypothetical protein